MKNIVLIGFMGSGKTRTGKLLAEKLKRTFADIDKLIEEKEKMSIQEIFRTRGEDAFRDMETRAVKEASLLRGAVVSAGGGAVLRGENVSALKASGILVWLKASPQTVLSRVGGAKQRPLLYGAADKEEAVSSLLAEREPVYRSVCDVEISTEEKTPEEVADGIIKIISEQGTGSREQGRC